jgi:hypothetical protein
VEDASQAEKSNQSFPLTIVFVERKVCLILYVFMYFKPCYFGSYLCFILVSFLCKVVILEYGLNVDKVQ